MDHLHHFIQIRKYLHLNNWPIWDRIIKHGKDWHRGCLIIYTSSNTIPWRSNGVDCRACRLTGGIRVVIQDQRRVSAAGIRKVCPKDGVAWCTRASWNVSLISIVHPQTNTQLQRGHCTSRIFTSGYFRKISKTKIIVIVLIHDTNKFNGLYYVIKDVPLNGIG